MRPTVVFIHGLYQGLGHLRETPFPGAAPVLVLDLLGYGEHSAAEPPDSIQSQVDHVVAELDRRGISRAILVGHSIGGAVAMLVAAAHPERVSAVVNVEGNFTLADAFWSSKVAAMPGDAVDAMVAGHRVDPAGWLSAQRMEATESRIARVKRMFDAQRGSAVRALARGIVAETARREYLPTIERVLDEGIPMHLLAGERSRAGWSLPEAFARRAASDTTQQGVGHMMPLEDPEGFLNIVAGLV